MENFRFEPVKTVGDAYDVMVDDQEDSLYYLAEDILDKGLNPAELVMVYGVAGTDEFTVVDGNRRLISLLAVLTPTMIPASMSTLRRKFEKLNATNTKIAGDDEVRCVVFPDKATAEYWIGKQHFGPDDGRGKDDWDSVQIDRFKWKRTGRKPIAFSAWEFAKEGADADVLRLMDKPSYYTNFERIAESRPAREIMGISQIRPDGTVLSDNATEVRQILRGVIKDLGSGSVNVNAIRRKKDIVDYISKIRERETGVKVPKSTKTTKCTSAHRNTVIPTKCKIPITDEKIVAIFNELRKLKVDGSNGFPFAGSFLLRALLELTVAKYVSAEQEFAKTLTNEKRKKELSYRLAKLFEYLEKDSQIGHKALIPYRKATLENKHVPLTEELNAYVHDPSFHPMPRDLITTWNNIEGLMQIVWNRIATKQQS